jgi:hypothetical protein
MFKRPASARTSRQNEASAIEGLMKEAQRQHLYSGAAQAAPAAIVASVSKLRHREEERRLGIVSDNDSDDDEETEFDDVSTSP